MDDFSGAVITEHEGHAAAIPDFPKSMPPLAEGACSLAWSWGSGSERIEDYFVSESLDGSHWLLWVQWENEDAYWEDEDYETSTRIVAWLLNRGLDSRSAARRLLHEYLSFEATDEMIALDRPHEFSESSALSLDELVEIFDGIWGEEAD